MEQARSDAKVAKYWATAPKSAISSDARMYPVDGRAVGVLKGVKS
jgi:hypothetical protein